MIHFGTGGWRAVIGDEFTRKNLEELAQGLAEKMIAEDVAKEGTVIGYDRRFLSKESMQWMAMVLAGNGIYTELINHSCPTPVTMFYVQTHALPYGMMVTASHNPAIYNGVKLFTRGGRDADITQTTDLEHYIANIQKVKKISYEEGIAKGLIKEINPMNDYIDYILDDLDLKAIRNANLRVGIDPMYGVSETCLRTVLITARCDVETIHGRHDPLFGGHLPAPEENILQELRAKVVTEHLNLGIATDGDADRIGVVDDTGRYLSANDLLLVLYWYLVKYRHLEGPCVRNLCTTERLDRLATRLGQKCYEVPVGFKWISAKMTETNAIIGGESSGGMAINGRIKGKDGIYAAGLLVEMLAVTGMSMSQIFDHLTELTGKTYMAEHNYRFAPELKEAFKKRIMEDKEMPEFPFEVTNVSYMDGCKVSFQNGWVSVRFSGTEPLLRIFCEMENQEDAEKICTIYKEFLGL